MDWTKAFADGGVTRLYLDAEKKFWVDVRDELTHAEHRMIALGSFKIVAEKGTGQTLDLDMKAGADQKMLAYIVDWNIPGKDGKTADISTPKNKADAFINLTDEAHKALETAIDLHVLAQQEKKSATNGALLQSPTSTSPGGSE